MDAPNSASARKVPVPVPARARASAPPSLFTAAELAESRITVPLERTISRATRRLAYRKGSLSRFRMTMHNGQRKLLISEIEYLTIYGHLSRVIVYAGAAPGIHINLLIRMFPNHVFHLYDPAKFEIVSSERVTVHREMFTDETAAKYANDAVLFISDIRTAEDKTEDGWDEEIEQNMADQQRWIAIMRPVISMVKFRLTWNRPTQEYLDGEVHLPVWGPLSTTETRLVTNGASTRVWDTREYEDILYRFNSITRQQWHDMPPDVLHNVPGVDHCGDCAAEVEILRAYTEKFADAFTYPLAKLSIAALMQIINDNVGGLNYAPHGEHRDIRDIDTRYRAMVSDGHICSGGAKVRRRRDKKH